MKTLHHTYQENPQTTPAVSIIMVLLAGLCALLGFRFESRAEREAYREHALRVRAAVRNVKRDAKVRVIYKNYIASWSGDTRLHWNKRMWTVWNKIGGDNYHPAKMGAKWSRLTRLLRALVTQVCKNSSRHGLSAAPYGVGNADSLNVKPPP